MEQWYIIPGYRCYEINIHDRRIRSLKHWKSDRFHIMKEKDGKVTLVNDYGKSTRVKVDDMYNRTFNEGNKLYPRGDYEYWTGGMVKGLRNCYPGVNILSGEQNPTTSSGRDASVDLIGNLEIERSEPIRPFIIDPDPNF